MLLAIDLGGTKLSSAIFSADGAIQNRSYQLLAGLEGAAIGALMLKEINNQLLFASKNQIQIQAIGVSVPGISDQKKRTVWAPNIPGWEQYPLFDEISSLNKGLALSIESDRSCYILGEAWQGAARGAEHAIFLAFGTGIGAGILANGQVLRGAHDIAGAIGWLALAPSYQTKYQSCGQFEYYCSGEGIARLAQEKLSQQENYTGPLKGLEKLTAYEVFEAYAQADPLAQLIFDQCIEYWGMVVANMVSLFNPQKIILGGGVFGPAEIFITKIHEEAKKWAQPISITQYELLASALGNDAGLYGAAYAALKKLEKNNLR